jgi:hypothetical protein
LFSTAVYTPLQIANPKKVLAYSWLESIDLGKVWAISSQRIRIGLLNNRCFERLDLVLTGKTKSTDVNEKRTARLAYCTH